MSMQARFAGAVFSVPLGLQTHEVDAIVVNSHRCGLSRLIPSKEMVAFFWNSITKVQQHIAIPIT